MTLLVAVLYILGYALIVASVFVVGPATKSAFSKMEDGARKLSEWESSERRRRYQETLHLEGDDRVRAQNKNTSDIENEMRMKAEDEALPYSSGVQIGGMSLHMIRSAVRQVGKANVPTAVLALVGGLLSTAASVFSLFLE